MTKDQAFATAFLHIAAGLPWPAEQRKLPMVWWDYDTATDAYARLAALATQDERAS